MIAAVTMLFATSCQKEELGTEVTVSFALSQPGIATKAYSDGVTAEKLTYAVYTTDATGARTMVKSEVVANAFAGNNLSTTVNMRLVTGQIYDIVFWADAATSPYTFDEDAGTITVNYGDAQNPIYSQDENRDAFYAVVADLAVTGAISQPVTLKRPFAQLNIGTTDAEEEAVTVTYGTVNSANMYSSVKVSGIYSTLNLLDGTVDDEEDDVLFALAPIPAASETFPVDGATYLSMNYLLVSAENDLVDIEFTVAADDQNSNSITREYTNVPVKRNYRTNIYGKLLTDPAAFNITIDPSYYEPDFEVSVWDGVSATEFTAAQLAAPEIEIASAADLAGIAKALSESNNNNNMFAGQTIKLTSDIDLANMEWDPIGNIEGGGVLGGTFDGNGHTIKNLKAKSTTSGSNQSAGLFGGLRNDGVIKNLNVVGAEITSGKYAGVIVGHMNGAGTNIINCHVSDVTLISNEHSVGGIVGFISGNVTCKVENCSVTNATIKVAQGRAGGLIGRIQGGIVKDCAVSNIAISPLVEGADLEHVGDFIGRVDNPAMVTLEGTNTVDGQAITLTDL